MGGGGRVDPLQAGEPGQVGPFRLLGGLGEGGMGRVFLGESPGGRMVAVKVVHPHYASDPEFRRRFAREVAAARQVGGFHTAAVVDADPEADPPWMATAYIPGPSLAQAVASGGPLDEARVRRLGAALAEGLAAIHDCGLIHRDLKPSNVILADDGPRIIDFGIARSASATALTRSSVAIGTLRYMSPEQLNSQELTSLSDVFSLGVVLAFAATGHDPFQAPTMAAVITRILTSPPDLDPLLGDLRAVIADCLAKDPGCRPVPRDLLARFSRPAPRDPTAVVAPAPALAPDTVSEVVPSPESRPTESEGPAVDTAQEQRPQPAPTPAHRRSRRRTGLIAVAAALVGLASVGIYYLLVNQTPGSSAAAVLTDPAGEPIASAAFGPGGVLAAGDDSGTTYLWNVTTDKVTATLRNPVGKMVDSLAFGPGGVLATGDNNGSTYLWNTATGKVTATFADPASEGADSVAFGPGDMLATGDWNGSTYLWNTVTGKLIATLISSSSQGVDSVAFGPDGILAVGDANDDTYLWNTATGKLIATLTGPGNSERVESAAFGTGDILATGDYNGTTYLWNVTTGKLTATLAAPTTQRVMSVAFGPSGVLAAGDIDGSTYVWNTATGKLTATFTPSGDGAAVAFRSDGLLATNEGSNIYLWHTTRG